MPKIQITPSGQYVVTIPISLARALQLKKGDELLVQITKAGTLEMIKSRGAGHD